MCLFWKVNRHFHFRATTDVYGNHWICCLFGFPSGLGGSDREREPEKSKAAQNKDAVSLRAACWGFSVAPPYSRVVRQNCITRRPWDVDLEIRLFFYPPSGLFSFSYFLYFILFFCCRGSSGEKVMKQCAHLKEHLHILCSNINDQLSVENSSGYWCTSCVLYTK